MLRFTATDLLKMKHCRVAANQEMPRTGVKHRRSGRKSAGPTPHDILWGALLPVVDGLEHEYEHAIPGRDFRLDLAVPSLMIAIEVDGWEWHGKHLGDFVRDRARQNLLVTHGWKVLRYTAGQIRKDLGGCVEQILAAVKESQKHVTSR